MVLHVRIIRDGLYADVGMITADVGMITKVYNDFSVKGVVGHSGDHGKSKSKTRRRVFRGQITS